MKFYLRAVGCQFPCGMTQCYLPANTSEHTHLNPSQIGWYSIYLPQRDED